MSEESLCLETGETVSLGQKIGEGAFGVVRQGVTEGLGTVVAVKLEPRDRMRKCLGTEVAVLRDLQCLSCVPRLLGQGVTTQHSYCVMEMLGESLNDKFKKCGRSFSLKTVAMIAEKTIAVLEALHGMKYVHRDVKPHNFLTGLQDYSEIYLIDFGMTKKYSESLEVRGSRGVSGTLPFISLNVHYGAPASRRDDLESLGYMFVYFLKGKLPWFDHRQEKLSEFAVKRRKEATSFSTLCEGLPSEFGVFLRYVRSLSFEQEPDYGALKVSFRILARRLDTENNWNYDWSEKAEDAVAARRQSVRSLKSAAGVSYTARKSLSHSAEEEKSCSLPDTPKKQPSLDATFFRVAKWRLSTRGDSLRPALTQSLTKSVSDKRKRARKFTGLAKLQSRVCASKGKLAACAH